MKSKSYIFLFVLIFMIVFSLSAVSADDLQTTDSGEVSGDVDVITVNPWDTSGELTYDIPAEAKEIKSADVYVNVYAGSAKNTYGANANVSLKTVNGENQIASEVLWIENGTSDGTIYLVNNHTDKCYSDYQMRYDITDSLKGLNGSSITIKVNTFEMENKTFDGRIKLIALVLAYDDGDDDIVYYWIDSTQRWTKTNTTTTFATANVDGIYGAELTNVALSSANGNYTLNYWDLGAPDNYSSGNYYQYSYWDVYDEIDEGEDTVILSTNVGTSTYSSLKDVLTVLKVTSIIADVSFKTEYTSVSSCYAGTNNTLTVKANTTKAGKYLAKLYADGVLVDVAEVELNSTEKTFLLTDPTIRPIDETTVNGVNNNKVNYEVILYLDGIYVISDLITVPVLYNGNLGYDLEYGNVGFEGFKYLVDGDVVIDVKDVSSYLGASDMNRTDVWTVNIPDNSSISKALLLIPYNWFNAKLYNETADMFDVTFNGETVAPSLFYRDQGNLGNYGQYGYGVVVYDVANLLNVSGDNTLVLNKKYPTPAVYPSTLIYAYNTHKDTLKEVFFNLGADLLSNTNNVAGRTVKSDTELNIVDLYSVNATLYVLAASAQAGDGNVVFNGVEFVDVWNGTSSTTDLFTADVTDIIDKTNNVSFVATKTTILSFAQFLVVDTGFNFNIDSVKTEYTSVPCIYAGTNNTLTVTVSSSISDNFTARLYADGELVNEINVTLNNGTNNILITDSTIRPIDETTVNGANNTEVKYEVQIIKGHIAYKRTITVPVLYNGNLGYDFEYGDVGFEKFKYLVDGDVVIDVKDVSSYLGASDMNRTDVWTVNIPDGSSISKALLLIPYNWFNAKLYNETADMFDVTFNGETVTPSLFYRDQGNLGNYGKYGYGVVVYDVANLLNVSGDNTLVLNKKYPTPAVYPSTLIYAYNTPKGTLKEFSFTLGADLLSNANNVAGRTVKSDTELNIADLYCVNATLYILAASAQAGEGNIVFNGVEFVDVWNGTSSSTDLFTADVTDIIDKTNNVSFVATGSTILSLAQFVVVDTGVYFDIDSVKTEYTSTPCIYAGTNNTLTVTVSSSISDNFTARLYADGEVVSEIIVSLTNGTNTFLITDPTIRPINETTVNGANNTEVKYELRVILKDSITYRWSKTVPVLYNGYLGKDLEYNATYIEDCTVITVNGPFVIDSLDDSSYMKAGDTNRTDVWVVDLIEGDSLECAFVYIAYNWDKTVGVDGPVLNVTFNGNDIVPKAHYRDQSNLGGASGRYGYGLYVYDVSGLIQDGNNTLVLNKPSGLTAVYPSTLLYAIDREGYPVFNTAYIFDGVDLLLNNYNNAGRLIKTDSQLNVTTKDICEAGLFVFAASGQPGEGNIVFNGVEYADVWNGTSNSYDSYSIDITDSIKDSNDVSFVSTGGTIVALQQIIFTTTIIAADVSLATEYSNTCFAGTENAITVKVSSVNYDGLYTIELLADGDVVDTTIAYLYEGVESTILLIDPTIRHINETTVNGVNNTNVEYTVNVKYNEALINSTSKTVPVLYNGYLGKDLEYNTDYIEDYTVITVTGDAVVDNKDDSTYMAAGDTNRTDVWEISLDSKSSFDSAFVYIAYNWDKTPGVDGPVLNVTFNGNDIVPKAHYRDQSNLGGASAKYGYGLFVYDVSGLIQNGNNTLVLNKESGLTAVYPSTLLYFFNTLDSNRLVNAYIADGADLLLASSYNNVGRLIKTDSQLNVNSKDVTEAKLWILAASAQAGEGNIVFNGVEDVNVWNGSSKSYDLYCKDITGSLKDSNDVSFVSTGGTIVALQQIILTAQKAPVTLTPKALTTTYDSGKAFTVTVTDVNNKPVSGLKLDIAVYTNGKAKTYHATTNANGVASLSSASKLAIGTHKVIVSSSSTKYVVSKVTSSIKVSKAKTTVKAPKVTAKVKKNKYFKVTVKNKATKKVVKNIKVKVKVYTGKKSKTYTIKTNSKGIAKLNTKNLKVGTHKVVITSGNAKYIISAKSKIVIKK